MKLYKVILLLVVFNMCAYACSKDTEDPIDEVVDANVDKEKSEGDDLTTKTTYDITNIISKLTEAKDMTYEIKDDYVYIYATGVPDHKSPYFLDTDWEEEQHEAYTVSGFRLNPNRIATHEYEFRIPLYPTEASTKSTTPMGAMGVAINGVPLYNQYAAGGADLTREIFSFDKYAGHPDGGGRYHYHIEPTYITENKGEDALVGVLLDGFPVYGPMENNETLSSDDLDDYHGHFGATADFPEGIYHYHITADAPYINGDGFYGVPGTVSR